jgi:hypothetical protein
MLLLVAVVVVALCVALYLFHRLRSLGKDLDALQTSLEGYVTLDEWEDSVQPSLSALEQKQQTIHRSLSVLSASVRGIREDLLWGATGAPAAGGRDEAEEEDASGQEEDGSEAGGREADEAALEAAQTSESNLQAMLFSMARLLQKEDEADGEPPPDAPAGPTRRAPAIAQARVLFGVPLARPFERPPSTATIEEELEEVEEPPAGKA